jgi:hypothetical protein
MGKQQDMDRSLFVNKQNVGGLPANDVSFHAHSNPKTSSSNDSNGTDQAFHQARRKGTNVQGANNVASFEHSGERNPSSSDLGK